MGALGFCIPYEFGTGDILACILFLEKHMYAGSSWPTIQYMTAEVQYGGKITDDLDRRLFATYCTSWMNASSLGKTFQFNPETYINPPSESFAYLIPDFQEHSDYVRYLETMPMEDSPELFGLHPNADLTFRIKSANALLSTLSSCQKTQVHHSRRANH